MKILYLVILESLNLHDAFPYFKLNILLEIEYLGRKKITYDVYLLDNKYLDVSRGCKMINFLRYLSEMSSQYRDNTR